jgi:hypothetical protein
MVNAIVNTCVLETENSVLGLFLHMLFTMETAAHLWRLNVARYRTGLRIEEK